MLHYPRSVSYESFVVPSYLFEIGRRRYVRVGLGRSCSAQQPASAPVDADGKVIAGFEKNQTDPNASKQWQPFSDRKIRVGIAGYGLCQFGAQFGFQDHPNVEVAAVTDLIPSRRDGLAKACRCETTYPSFEEMTKDDSLEAVFIATDAQVTRS